MKTSLKTFTLLSTISLFFSFGLNAENPDRVFINTGKAGIYSGIFSYENGTLTEIEPKIEGIDSHYIAKHPSLPVLYSINQLENDTSAVVSYDIAEDGSLHPNGKLENLPGGGAHISVSSDGKWIAVAYYGSGWVGVYSTDTSGAIKDVVFETLHEGSGPTRRQSSPRPHWAGFSDDGRFLYVADLGTDEIWVYAFDSTTAKVELAFKSGRPPGSTPRHLAFHPTLPFAWLTNEIAAKVTGYQVDTITGALSEIETLVAAEEAKYENWSNVSHLLIHPNGQFLYVVNRGFDEVSIFKINQESGTLSPVEREPIRGHMSRNIAISEDGAWALVSGMLSNTLAVFKVDPDTGRMSIVNRRVYNLPTPRAIVIDG